MNTYYIEYLNKNGMDRETVIEATNPQHARNIFHNEYDDVDCVLDMVDTTNEVNVLEETV